MDTMGDEIIGDEIIGDELDGDDVDGLAVVGRGARMKRAIGLRIRAPALRGASTQGISRPKEELDSLPFVLDLTVPAGGTTSPLAGTLIAFPQRPFRGERLILAASYLPAAGGVVPLADSVVITPAWYVGAVQVGASQGAMPFSAFAATAFGVRLSIPAAGQGTRIFIPFSIIPNITAGDSVSISGVLIGRAVR